MHLRSVMPSCRLVLCLLAASVALPQQTLLAEDSNIDQQIEKAIQTAVDKVAPSVVRIETIGGLEKIGQLLVGTGPTTGLIVSEDGYIISSAFNFVRQPSSILVTLPDGKRVAAERIATDNSRMLVLLKVKTDKKLPVPEAAPQDEIKVGQWSIAVGRSFEGDNPNTSVGVVSATERIFGRAIQTDAKISPNNYGGPLIDIHGRVLGVLVPLSAQGNNQVAGVQWYDAGIGFAAPYKDIQDKLDELKEGKDLQPGLVGVSLKPGHPYDSPAEVAVVQPSSPAYKAGLKVGDVILDVNGKPISTQMQFRLAVGHRYAGDTVSLTVKRGDEELQKKLELVSSVTPSSYAFLGILPYRLLNDAETDGVLVRWVYPKSPAAEAGLRSGDVLTEINGQAVTNVAEARELTATLSPGDKISIKFERDGAQKEANVAAGAMANSIPQKLPAARDVVEEFDGERPLVGSSKLQLAEFKNECYLYVPESYHPDVAYGVVLWLHNAGGNKQDEIVSFWKKYCDDNDLILVAPQSTDPTKWDRSGEAEMIKKFVDSVISSYNVDRNRIVAHGHQAGGAMAYAVAFQNRELFTGVAVVDSPLPITPTMPQIDPVYHLAFFSASADDAEFAARIKQSVEQLQKGRYPVTEIKQGDKSRYLNDEEVAKFIRWVDSLDKL